MSVYIFLKACGSFANVKQSVPPMKRYLIGYKTVQKLSRFVTGQLSTEGLRFALGVGRRPTGFLKDLCPQIFQKFYLFYLRLYVIFLKVIGLAVGNTSRNTVTFLLYIKTVSGDLAHCVLHPDVISADKL